MRYCYEIFKVAVEPSAATGLATVLSNNFKKKILFRIALRTLGLFFLGECGPWCSMGIVWIART
ncbi:putative serine racemase, Ammonia-lyase [Helianthus anomalus]